MSDTVILQEMALNKREIHHDTWGSFVISRPSNRVMSKIETAKTKSTNRDLQSSMLVDDMDNPGKTKQVPAILTRKSKEKVLRLHQEWTDEDDKEVQGATKEYQDVCFALEEAGFRGIDFVTEEYEKIHERLKEKLGDNYDKHFDKVATVIPTVATEPRTEENEEELLKSFTKSKRELEKLLKDLSLMEDFARLDVLHKQYRLYLKGILAQTRLYVIKLKEITLFSDTVEARSEKEGQLVKIFECTKTREGKSPWGSFQECEESEPDFLAWLLGQIERFQNLDPTEEAIDERVRNRFNFLFPLGATTTLYEELDAQRQSSYDGEQLEETQNSSSEDLDIEKAN